MRETLDTPKEEDAEQAEIMTSLRDAEKKFRKLVEKRNEINDQAREAREERDALNEQKKTLVQDLRGLQALRDSKNAEAREHKEKRNEFQRQAKALIEEKRKMRTTPADGGKPGAGSKLRDLEGELRRLERQQETTAMTIAKENELLKRVGEIRKELAMQRQTYGEEAKILSEIQGVDGKIDALFRMADDAHKIVVGLSNEAQAAHDQIGPILDQLKFLDAESDKKHQAYLAMRADADKFHAEASTLREEVEKLRDKRSMVFKERRAIVGDQRAAVKEALFDDIKIEEKADDAVKALMSGGKITL